MKKTLVFCSLLGLSMSAPSFARGILNGGYGHGGYNGGYGGCNGYESHHDDDGNASNCGGIYIDHRITDYCWTTKENGKGVLGDTFFGAWRDLPRAQANATAFCLETHDETYCREHLQCEANDPNDGM